MGAESHCNDIKIDWSNRHGSFLDCANYCTENGATVIVYRTDDRDCSCCNEPITLVSNSGSSVYGFKDLNGIIFCISV